MEGVSQVGVASDCEAFGTLPSEDEGKQLTGSSNDRHVCICIGVGLLNVDVCTPDSNHEARPVGASERPGRIDRLIDLLVI